METWLEKVRADFPSREGWVYLQSAGTGRAFPGAAAAAGQYYVDTADLGCDAQPRWRERTAGARSGMARLLAVPPEEVGFFRSTSEVINLAAAGCSWKPGDEIVVFDDEYPCNVLPWLSAEAAGATVVRVSAETGEERQQRLLEALTPRTRIVSVAHVHPWTGTRLDLVAVGRACRDADALLVVDGIQALGATDVDLSYVDVFGAGMFKWMLSGFGTAVGVFRERARDRLTPPFRSYGNPAPSTSFEYSAPNIPGLYVLDATLSYLESLGWDRIFGRVKMLAGRTIDILKDLDIRPLTPEHAHAGIVGFQPEDSTWIAKALAEEGVSVSDKEGRVLVSPHFYNSEDDIERFGQALAGVLKTLQ